jgi:Amt family ammonium transporter
MKQLAAIALSSVWAFLFTYAMLWLIDLVTPVKVDQAAEERGLDAALHGETAYLGGH